MVWHLDRFENRPGNKAMTEVAMQGKWKLLARHGKPVELFDLAADPFEKRNLIDEHPERVAALTAEVEVFLNAPRVEIPKKKRNRRK